MRQLQQSGQILQVLVVIHARTAAAVIVAITAAILGVSSSGVGRERVRSCLDGRESHRVGATHCALQLGQRRAEQVLHE